jgi:hypothetical protein
MVRHCLIVCAVVVMALQPLDTSAQNKSKTKRAPCADKVDNVVSRDGTCAATKLPAPSSATGLIGRGAGLSGPPGSQFEGKATGAIPNRGPLSDKFQKPPVGPATTKSPGK